MRGQYSPNPLAPILGFPGLLILWTISCLLLALDPVRGGKFDQWTWLQGMVLFVTLRIAAGSLKAWLQPGE